MSESWMTNISIGIVLVRYGAESVVYGRPEPASAVRGHGSRTQAVLWRAG